NEVIGAKGLKVIEPDTTWSVYYTELGNVPPPNQSSFRKAYRDGLARMTAEGRTLVVQRDIYLHGKLGIEFVLSSSGLTSYMRAFVVGQRLYTLAAHRKTGDVIANGDVPGDVKQFFDSFAHWE